MKVKRMGITEILRRIWLFSTNRIKSSESGSEQPTQLIVELNSSLRHIIVTIGIINLFVNYEKDYQSLDCKKKAKNYIGTYLFFL